MSQESFSFEEGGVIGFERSYVPASGGSSPVGKGLLADFPSNVPSLGSSGAYLDANLAQVAEGSSDGRHLGDCVFSFGVATNRLIRGLSWSTFGRPGIAFGRLTFGSSPSRPGDSDG